MATVCPIGYVILRVLAANRVEYVVIGGLAVQAHGHPRTTQDIDPVPEPTDENRARLLAALTELGARAVGAAPYVELRERALVIELDVPVVVAGRDDLIAMKRTSGRPIDRSDIIALTEP
jgi:hypothetical protein